jgi:kynureninase
LSLLVKKNGRHLFDHLTTQGVIADWREPDVIRIAAVPLYNTKADLEKFLFALR